jgi:hypothetical protein
VQVLPLAGPFERAWRETALKKLAKAKQKAAEKAERQQRAREAGLLAAPVKSHYTGTMAGKHGRAREARLGIQTEGEAATHRARGGGAPVLSEVLPEHRGVVVALERRLRGRWRV